jgi:hypothetical protein
VTPGCKARRLALVVDTKRLGMLGDLFTIEAASTSKCEPITRQGQRSRFVPPEY